MLPDSYDVKVYAGVLGKIIGVYAGRPFEGWTYQKIIEELGEVNYYVHEKLKVPLIVTDDDITGTFTFLRALEDNEYDTKVTSEQIGNTWLNYLIEDRTILWWGGLGNSTEHTAYLRLKKGISAPRSGSIALNGKIVAEQVGSQIFIDGWAMVSPGQPDLARDLACKAASVSHDGEALNGAIIIAVMESLAFIESDLNCILDKALSYIPQNSVIFNMIQDIRKWRVEINDWHEARMLLEKKYGYQKYGGNCHIVPNHGLIILALLYGDDSFQKSLMIVNTSGWDTDCNAGNLGCFLGIKNGLEGLEAGPDWRGPIADRIYLPTADGSRAISDALTESIRIINIGRRINGLEPIIPKEGARFHFSLPGSVQGFQVDNSIESKETATLENVERNGIVEGRSLSIQYRGVALGRSCLVGTPTFIPKENQEGGIYSLMASPTLYGGQHIAAHVTADSNNNQPVNVCLYTKVYDQNDDLERHFGPETIVKPDAEQLIEWRLPDTKGYPVAEVGLKISSSSRSDGKLYLNYLTWDGQPEMVLTKTPGGTMWYRAWVNGADHFIVTDEPIRVVQNDGTGIVMHGTGDWKNYKVTAIIKPHMAESCGIGVRASGMKRYYAFILSDNNKIQLIKCVDEQTILAEQPMNWEYDVAYKLSLQANGNELIAWINDRLVFHVSDSNPLSGGAAALICKSGRLSTDKVIIETCEI